MLKNALHFITIVVMVVLPVVPGRAASRTWTVIVGPRPKPHAVATQAFPRTIEVAASLSRRHPEGSVQNPERGLSYSRLRSRVVAVPLLSGGIVE